MTDTAKSDAIPTVEQMRAAEQAAIDGGTSEWALMQRAGQGAAHWIARIAAGRAVTVLCGPGNNGGDGYVIAEDLRRRGLSVRVIAPVEPKTETAKKARESFGGTVERTCTAVDTPIVVDALFGYGLSRAVEGEFAELLGQARASGGYIVAIDVPSGVSADDAALLGPVPQCDLTLALGAWKPAHFLMPAMARMGEKRLVPIGLDLPADKLRLAAPPRIDAPEPDAHKYRRGLVAIVAGAMPGAPLLSAQAAMRSGAGYAKLFSAHSHPDAPADLVIDEGDLAEGLGDDRIAAMLVGPGLGRDVKAADRLSIALSAKHNCVLDADALMLLDPAMLDGVDAARICVTPHEGELASLCRAFHVAGDAKLAQARGLHDATGLTVLAKGPDTILVGADGVRLFERGSSWLSVAGSGDVLAGIVASRLAVHGELERACEEGVHLHHRAARVAGAAFTADELAHRVADALEDML